MIAHRFGYALAYGAAALNTVPVFGHGCDNPLGRCWNDLRGDFVPVSMVPASGAHDAIARSTCSAPGLPVGAGRGYRGVL